MDQTVNNKFPRRNFQFVVPKKLLTDSRKKNPKKSGQESTRPLTRFDRYNVIAFQLKLHLSKMQFDKNRVRPTKFQEVYVLKIRRPTKIH